MRSVTLLKTFNQSALIVPGIGTQTPAPVTGTESHSVIGAHIFVQGEVSFNESEEVNLNPSVPFRIVNVGLIFTEPASPSSIILKSKQNSPQHHLPSN